MIEYKEKEDEEWVELRYPPGKWLDLKLLSERWNVSIRETNSNGLVSREYHPYVEKS